ncbi:MAG: sulfatase [Candidatus Cyclobacteriaceae bacterium M3_2C_046]
MPVSHWFTLFLIFGFISCEKKLGSPNILLIVVDDLGWRDLGCYGNDFYETPNIDHLAGKGALFSQAYAAASLCSPTRAAILTGKSPARLGITNRIAWWEKEQIQQAQKNADYLAQYQSPEGKSLKTPQNAYWLEKSEETIAELLQKAGYQTAHIGKWHLGEQEHYPEHQGFDINRGGCYLGDPPSYFDPYADQEIAGIPTLPAREKGEYLTNREIDEALQFIENAGGQPFFLNLWHYAVHTPIEAPADMVQKYKSKTNPNNFNPVYAAMIDYVDQGLGRLMQVLEKRGLKDRTIIVFTSDNGGLDMPYAANNDPLRAGKGYPYEGGIRIPLIISGPGIKTQVIDQPVISMDLFPTIASLAGIDMADESLLDGTDLSGSLKDQSMVIQERELTWHFPHYRSNQYTVYGEVIPHSILRHGNYKLIKYYGNKSPELYNLDQDLSELHNLALKDTALTRRLEEKLFQLLNQQNARFPGVL